MTNEWLRPHRHHATGVVLPTVDERTHYEGLRHRVLQADHNTFPSVARSVQRYLVNGVEYEDPNPVYAEALVTMVLRRALEIIGDLQEQPEGHWVMMTTARLTQYAVHTQDVWRETMDNNASNPEER